MYLRPTRDGRPDVLARLAAVPPPPSSRGASSATTVDRPASQESVDDHVVDPREAVDREPDAAWTWDDPRHTRLPDAGPPVPRWVDDVGPDPFGTDPSDLERRRPRRRERTLTAPPAAIALVVIGVLACIVTVVTVASGSSDEVPTAVAFPSSAGSVPRSTGEAPSPAGPRPSSAAPAPSPAAELVVSVVGLVRSPGLVRLPPSARIADAIARAGGGRPGADLLGLNMAQVLHDGDQVLVGYADPAGGPALRSAVVGGGGGASGPSTGASGSSSAARPSAGGGGGKVDLNAADEAALDALPGVGPKTAAAILEWRQRNGRFSSVDQLAEVDGIGPAKFASLRDLVTV